MATYQPPTEILPKFNEFVFNQANSPEYLDQLVVHKAGTETITGNKTITGTLTANNTTTSLTASIANYIISPLNWLIASSGVNTMRTTTGSNNMECLTSGSNNITTSSGINTIQTGIGSNQMVSVSSGTNSLITFTGLNEMRASTTGTNTITSATGRNTITTGNITSTANLIDATGVGGGNTIRTISGTNFILTTTGKNVISSPAAGTLGASSNIIDNTAVGGGNMMRCQGTGGVNFLQAPTNTIESYTASGYNELTCGSNYLLQNTTRTEIYSPDIDARGDLYATRYLLGVSTGLSRPLSSMVLGGLNTVSLPNVASGATTTTSGNWASGGQNIRTPSYGSFYPQFITIQLSGSFTGGTSPTIRIEVMNGSASPDAIIASTGNISYTSAMTVFPTGASSLFTTVNALGDGILYYVRYVIVNGSGTAITVSTKQAFVQIYGYQTN